MPGWAGSDRLSRLPDNWRELVALTRERAHGRCEAREWDGSACESPGSDCDHIEPGDNHALDNLQWLCRRHHLEKSGREGAIAAKKARAKRQFNNAHLTPQVSKSGRLRT